MTAAERHAIKVLVDRATRAKLVADGIRAGHGARLHGDIAIGQARGSSKPSRIGNLRQARTVNGSRPRRTIAEDEQLLAAQEIEYGASHEGYLLPSMRGRRVAA